MAKNFPRKSWYKSPFSLQLATDMRAYMTWLLGKVRVEVGGGWRDKYRLVLLINKAEDFIFLLKTCAKILKIAHCLLHCANVSRVGRFKVKVSFLILEWARTRKTCSEHINHDFCCHGVGFFFFFFILAMRTKYISLVLMVPWQWQVNWKMRFFQKYLQFKNGFLWSKFYDVYGEYWQATSVSVI